jgi:pimeloyl-ACP methyl ester carboxylesterase
MPLLLHYIAERRARSARWEAALRDTRIALSLVWGMADPVSGRTMLDWLTTTVPGARATPLERVGHYPQVESPREVAAVIRAAASAT